MKQVLSFQTLEKIVIPWLEIVTPSCSAIAATFVISLAAIVFGAAPSRLRGNKECRNHGYCKTFHIKPILESERAQLSWHEQQFQRDDRY